MNLTNMPELKLGIVAVSVTVSQCLCQRTEEKQSLHPTKERSTNVRLLWRAKLTCRKL